MPKRRKTGTRVLVVMLLLLAGCGGGSGGGGDSGESSAPEVSSTDPGSSLSSTEVGSAPSSTGSTGATKGPNRPRIERPSGTPLGQVVPIPPGGPAYLLLATGKCSELLKLVGGWEGKIDKKPLLLYRAAAEACLQRWGDAQRDYDQLLKLNPVFGEECGGATCEACMRAVLAWLGPLLEARQREPNLEPVYVKGTQASPCPDFDTETTTTQGSTTTSSRSTTTTRATTASR